MDPHSTDDSCIAEAQIHGPSNSTKCGVGIVLSDWTKKLVHTGSWSVVVYTSRLHESVGVTETSCVRRILFVIPAYARTRFSVDA